MTPLKLLLPKIVMVSVLQNLTKGITNQNSVGNPFEILENHIIRNPQGLIINLDSLKEKPSKPNLSLELNLQLLSITKKPYATSVVSKAILLSIAG